MTVERGYKTNLVVVLDCSTCENLEASLKKQKISIVLFFVKFWILLDQSHYTACC